MKTQSKVLIVFWAIMLMLLAWAMIPHMLRGVFTVDQSIQHQELTDNKPKFICPEDYTDDYQRNNDLRLFILDYERMYPKATVGDFQAYRTSILINNHCKIKT